MTRCCAQGRLGVRNPEAPGEAFIAAILVWAGIVPDYNPWWDLPSMHLRTSGFIITDPGSNTDIVTHPGESADVILLKIFPDGLMGIWKLRGLRLIKDMAHLSGRIPRHIMLRLERTGSSGIRRTLGSEKTSKTMRSKKMKKSKNHLNVRRCQRPAQDCFNGAC